MCFVHAVDLTQLPKPKHVEPFEESLGACMVSGCHFSRVWLSLCQCLRCCWQLAMACSPVFRQMNLALSLETANCASGEADAHQRNGPVK